MFWARFWRLVRASNPHHERRCLPRLDTLNGDGVLIIIRSFDEIDVVAS